MTRDEALTVMGLTGNPDQTLIKLVYRRLAAKAHPDGGGSSEKWAQLRAAYEALTGPTPEESQAGAVKRAEARRLIANLRAKIDVEEARCKQYSAGDFRRKILAELKEKLTAAEKALADGAGEKSS